MYNYEIVKSLSNDCIRFRFFMGGGRGDDCVLWLSFAQQQPKILVDFGWVPKIFVRQKQNKVPRKKNKIRAIDSFERGEVEKNGNAVTRENLFTTVILCKSNICLGCRLDAHFFQHFYFNIFFPLTFPMLDIEL
jgi:hypothetical protein